MISVIIPTCNRNVSLSRCLDKLKLSVQCLPDDVYEVIVTDDSKNTATKELIITQYPWAKWVKGPLSGPAANRNNGAKYAKGNWLLFIDDDCIPDNSLLKNYRKAIDINIGIEVFEGCIKANREKQNFLEESPINESGGHLWSCNFMIKKDLFFKINGFDHHFPFAAMEDVDLQCRLKKLNTKIVFVVNAVVIHPWRAEKQILTKTKNRFKSTLYFLNKHPEMRSNINAAYFFRAGLINLKNTFKYAYRFKFRGFDKQLILTLFHFYFAFFLFLKYN